MTSLYLVADRQAKLMTVPNEMYHNILLRGASYREAEFIHWANETWGPDTMHRGVPIETVQAAVDACAHGGWMVLHLLRPTAMNGQC